MFMTAMCKAFHRRTDYLRTKMTVEASRRKMKLLPSRLCVLGAKGSTGLLLAKLGTNNYIKIFAFGKTTLGHR